MPVYRVYRMKQLPQESFRWAAHAGGLALVRPKDYDPSGEVEAATTYSAWKILSISDRPLAAGDILETLEPADAAGELRIAKYIGFEPAEWLNIESRLELPPPRVATQPIDAPMAS